MVCKSHLDVVFKDPQLSVAVLIAGIDYDVGRFGHVDVPNLFDRRTGLMCSISVPVFSCFVILCKYSAL